jgi:hypothetical protein
MLARVTIGNEARDKESSSGSCPYVFVRLTVAAAAGGGGGCKGAVTEEQDVE